MQGSSDQEDLLTAFAAYSLGAYPVFQPQPYRKGTAVREPADLAWVVRDTVVLLNMQRARRLDRQTDHNLKQLKGWLRAWAAGTPLQGANHYARYDVELEDVAHVLLISVVHGPDARSRLVDVPEGVAPEAATRVRGALELPEQVLIELAKLRGTAVDLVDFAMRLSRHPDGLSLEESIEDLHASHRLSVDRGLLSSDQIVRRRASAEMRRWAIQGVTEHLKAAATRRDSGGVEEHTDVGPFADLAWEQAATAAGMLAATTEAVAEAEGPSEMAAFVELGNYALCVGAASGTDGSELLETASRWRERARADEGYPLSVLVHLSVAPDIPVPGLIVATEDPTGPTQVGEALEELDRLRKHRDSRR